MSSDSMSPQSFTSVGYLSASGVSITSATDLPGADIESNLWGNSVVLREILNYIESIEYSCELGMALNPSMLKRIMGEIKKVQELIDLCKDHDVAIFILGHMLEITTRPIDTHYPNPWEMAMVTYLYALTQARTDLNRPAIAVSRRLVNSHWPERYIENFLR